MKVASLVGEIRKSVGAEAQMLVLTPEDLERLRREDPAFYHSLVFRIVCHVGGTDWVSSTNALRRAC